MRDLKREGGSSADRALAIALWSVFGGLLGLAAGVWVSSPPVLALIGAALGAIYGVVSTRSKAGAVTDDDG